MPAPYAGKCLCGAVIFTISSEPATVLSCFCEHCSKGAGGPNQVLAKFTHQDVNIQATQGQISTYTFIDTSSGSPKEKAFCKTCGATLWTVPGSAKGAFLLIRTSLLAGGLGQLKPKSEIFVKNRPSWLKPVDDVSQWEEARRG